MLGRLFYDAECHVESIRLGDLEIVFQRFTLNANSVALSSETVLTE